MFKFKVIKMWQSKVKRRVAGCDVEVFLESTGEHAFVLQKCSVFEGKHGLFAVPMAQYKTHAIKLPGDNYKRLQKAILETYQVFVAGAPTTYRFNDQVEFIYNTKGDEEDEES